MSTVPLLLSVSDFVNPQEIADEHPPSYWYTGICPQTGKALKLPRTALVEAIARSLQQAIAQDEQHNLEGKMYGVLLVETPKGEHRVLKAFSGLLQGQSIVAGWVHPIPGRAQVALEEERTLAALAALKQELIELNNLPVRKQYELHAQVFEHKLNQLAERDRQRKQERQQQRQILSQTLTGEALDDALEQLNRASQLEGIERRKLKQQRDAIVQPLKHQIEQANLRMRELKQQRKLLSRQLQTQMHAAYHLTNFAGQSVSLQQLMHSIPTGTGDCCAPKLLHYAATHQLKPLAMAEFWWGGDSANGDKVAGEFYGACTERCQPLMGFLLSGLPQRSPILSTPSDRPVAILYEDAWLIAVDKPAGLLSVPGRYRDRQDSVLTRLRHEFPDGESLIPAHRLDQETSGILLFARDPQTHRQISEQFQQRQVHKVYEAILAGSVPAQRGVINLPLWADPSDRPRQKVDWQRGKPSLTHFQVIDSTQPKTRIEFVPITGRTHQLRVHAADAQGLGVPIWGDRLYGRESNSHEPRKANRLHLHAKQLSLKHPHTQTLLQLQAEVPF